MRTLVVGCNHRSAPVEVRERIAFDPTTLPDALALFHNTFPDSEVVLLATCNRIEAYVARPVHSHPRIEEIIEFIAQYHNLGVHEFAEGLYSYEDVEAVRHLFRVTCSLDSMVLGETQILGQTKSAFETARCAGTVGKRLEPLFQQAFSVAKEIQTKTTIASGHLSVGSTAVDLARQIFARFDDKRVLMVGTGKMGELTLMHLLNMKPKQLYVSNRTHERAVALAAKLTGRSSVSARAIAFDDWLNYLVEADIVITSTGSREPILTSDMFASIPARRKYRPLLLIDIAVPRDIDPAVGKREGVYLYNIDDLQTVTEASLADRREAIGQCNDMIDANVITFVERQSHWDLRPVITAMQEHFRDVETRELERVLPKFENLSNHDRQLIEGMLHRITQKLLHDPIHVMNEKTGISGARLYADTLRTLFNLPHDES